MKTDIFNLSFQKLVKVKVVFFMYISPLGASSDPRAIIFKFNFIVERTLVFLNGLQRFKCHVKIL